jgi:hypothetical protein
MGGMGGMGGGFPGGSFRYHGADPFNIFEQFFGSRGFGGGMGGMSGMDDDDDMGGFNFGPGGTSYQSLRLAVNPRESVN